MELGSGYKQIDARIIPIDWSIKKLQSLALYITVGFVGSMSYLFKSSGVPLLRGMNILPGALELSTLTYISINTHKQWKKSALLPGDVVLVRVGYPGTAAVIPNGLGDINAASLVIVRPQYKILDSNYLCYYLNSQIGKLEIFNKLVGGAQQVFNTKTASDLEIPLPPTKREQTAIAQVLSDTDELISSLEKLIEKKKLIKQGTMQQLLTGKKRLPGFSGECEEKKLGEIAFFLKGRGLPKSALNSGGEYECIHYGELFTKYNEQIREVFSKTDYDYGYFKSQTNDVLMPTSDVTPTGLATASCVMKNGVILGGDILVIRVDKNLLNGVFLSYCITCDKAQVLGLVSGITVFHLYAADMKKFQLYLPPIEEQEKIIKILGDMECEIESLEQKLNKYKAIKQGMMHNLLTGKIRLV